MKKLLLLIVPMLLFFGVSLGETFTFGPVFSNQNYYGPEDGNQTFSIIGQSGNTINLWSITPGNNQTDCSNYDIHVYDGDTNPIIKSGLLSTGAEVVVNYNISPGNYYISFHGGGCSRWRSNTAQVYSSGFFYSGPGSACIYPCPMSNPSTATYYSMNVGTFVFSGTDPRIAVQNPINIYYNGTSVSFAGSNIYLTDLFHNYTMSGSDIIFTPYVYRALFRSH